MSIVAQNILDNKSLPSFHFYSNSSSCPHLNLLNARVLLPTHHFNPGLLLTDFSGYLTFILPMRKDLTGLLALLQYCEICLHRAPELGCLIG